MPSAPRAAPCLLFSRSPKAWILRSGSWRSCEATKAKSWSSRLLRSSSRVDCWRRSVVAASSAVRSSTRSSSSSWAARSASSARWRWRMSR